MTLSRRQFVASSLLIPASPGVFAQTKEIPVGVLNALTGEYAYGGIPIQNGIRLALEQASAAGLPGGARFKLFEGDTAGEKAQAISLVNQVIRRDKVSLILGLTTSSEALASAPVANEMQVPVLANASSSAILNIGPWVYKVQATGSEIMNFLGRLAVEQLGVKRLVCLCDQTNDGLILQKDALVNYVKNAGVSIVADEKFLASQSNFLALATKVAMMQTDAVYIAASAEVGANLIIQLRQAGLDPKVKIIGSSAFSSDGFTRVGGKAVEGVYLVSDYSPTSPTPQNAAFVAAYKAKYKAVPDNWAGVGYALGTVAVQAVRNAGPDPDRKSIRDALARLNNVPVVLGNGVWSVDEKHNPSYGGVLLQVKGGRFTPVQ